MTRGAGGEGKRWAMALREATAQATGARGAQGLFLQYMHVGSCKCTAASPIPSLSLLTQIHAHLEVNGVE